MPLRNVYLRVVGAHPDAAGNQGTDATSPSATKTPTKPAGSQAATKRPGAASRDAADNANASSGLYVAGFVPDVGAVSIPVEKVGDYLLKPAASTGIPTTMAGSVNKPVTSLAMSAPSKPGNQPSPDADEVVPEGSELYKLQQQQVIPPDGPAFVCGVSPNALRNDADDAFRSKGTGKVYVTPFATRAALGVKTTALEPNPSEPPKPPGSEQHSSAPPSPPGKRGPHDDVAVSLPSAPTAVSIPAAVQSCGGDAIRGSLFYRKSQQAGSSSNNGSGKESASFKTFEALIVSPLPRVLPVDAATRELKAFAALSRSIVADAMGRRNVTVVHRGVRNTGKSRAFRDQVRLVLEQLSPVFERALQLYHDEVARAAEEEALAAAALAARGGGAGAAAGNFASGGFEAFADGGEASGQPNPDGDGGEARTRPRGASTRHGASSARSTRFGSPRPGTSGGASSWSATNTPRGRFTLLSIGEGAVAPTPPRGTIAVANGVDLSPRRSDARGGAGAGGAGVRWGAGQSDSAAGGKSAKQRGSLFNRRSSVKLRQALTALMGEPRLRKQLKHNGHGHEWNAATFNGRTSTVQLPGLPNAGRIMSSFAVDMWIRVADVAGESKFRSAQSTRGGGGGGAPTDVLEKSVRTIGEGSVLGAECSIGRVPMTLLRWCENDKADVGMQFHLGINFAKSPHDDSIRVYARDSTNRVLDMNLTMIGSALTDGGWHHLHVHCKSLEDTALRIFVDGLEHDSLRFAQAEHPNSWTSFGAHHMFVGGFKDPNTGALATPFAGQIAEVRVWHADDAAHEIELAKHQAAMHEYQRVQAHMNTAAVPRLGGSADGGEDVGPTMTTATGLTVPIATRFGKYRSKAKQESGDPSSPSSLAPLLNVEKPVPRLVPIVRYPLMAPVHDSDEDINDEQHTADDSAGEGVTPKSFLDQVVKPPSAASPLRISRGAKNSGPQPPRGGAGGSRALEPSASGAVDPAATDESELPHASSLDVETTCSIAPVTAPAFDGQTACVNVGSLGEFGGFLQSFAIEVRFKTVITDRRMALLGVTDTQFQKPTMCIVLNAEPTMTSDRIRFHKHHIAFVLVDATGRAMSAILRGSEQQHLCDGQWHTLSWRVHDAESHKMEVKVDGRSQDAVVSVREGPKNFVPLHEWLAIGAHNVRGWRVRDAFEGSINRCTFTVRGDTYAEWMLDEGPGAVMAIDGSGHGFHGAYHDIATKARAKHGLAWAAQNDDVKEDDELLDGGAAAGEGGSGGGGGGKRAAPVIHLRNDVRFALLNFSAQVDPATGKVVEAVYDMLAPAPPPKQGGGAGGSAVGGQDPTRLRRKMSLLRMQRQMNKEKREKDERRRSLRMLKESEQGDGGGGDGSIEGAAMASSGSSRAGSDKGSGDDEDDSKSGVVSPVEQSPTAALANEFPRRSIDDEDQAAVAASVKTLPPPEFGARRVDLEFGPTEIVRTVRGLTSDKARVWANIPASCFQTAETSAQPKNTLAKALHFVAEADAYAEELRREALVKRRAKEAAEDAKRKKAAGGFGSASGPADGGSDDDADGALLDATAAAAKRRATMIEAARARQSKDRYGHMPRIGHLVAVVRVGDCQLTFVDMKGPILPKQASYAPHMTRWTMPVSTYGSEQKITGLLNGGHVSLDAALQHASAFPSLARRSGMMHDPTTLVSQLQKQSYPVNLGAVVYAALLNVEFGSRLHHVFSLPVYHTEDEALSLAAPMRALDGKTLDVAAIAIQRVIRGLFGRLRARRVAESKALRARRVHELASARASNKAFLPKSKLHATVIAVLDVHTGPGDALSSLAEYEAEASSRRRALDASRLGATSDAKLPVDPTMADLLPPIEPRILARVVAGLTAQGYSVRTVINPTAGAIADILKALDPAVSNFVYVLGYGATTFALPPLTRIDAIACSYREDAARSVVVDDAKAEWSSLLRVEKSERAEVVLAIEARSKKGKKGAKGRAGSATPQRAKPAAPPSKPAAAPTPRKGGRGARGATTVADAEAAAAEAAARSALLAETKSFEFEEEQARVTDVTREYDRSWSLLSTELRRAITALRNHEDACKLRQNAHTHFRKTWGRHAAATQTAAPTATESRQRIVDLAATMPMLMPATGGAALSARGAGALDNPAADQCLGVQDIVQLALKADATPAGYQGFVAVDLVPTSTTSHTAVSRAESAETIESWDAYQVQSADTAAARPHGAFMLATTAGHGYSFAYRPGVALWGSWQLAKALHGHIAANIVNDQQASGILYGAVPSLPDDGCRDAVTVIDYIGAKMASSPAVDTQLTRLLPDPSVITEQLTAYNGDLVPLRNEPTTSASRDEQRKPLESKRASGMVRLAVEAEKSALEVTTMLRTQLADLQSSEALPSNTVLVTFERSDRTSPKLRSLANIDLAAVREQLERFVPTGGPVTCTIALTTHGLAFTVLPTGATSTNPTLSPAEKTKVAAAVNSLAQRASVMTFPCIGASDFEKTRCAAALRQAVADMAAQVGVPAHADPCVGSTHFAIRDVCIVYTARGTTTVKRWHRVLRRSVERPVLADGVRIIGCVDD